MMNFYRRNWYHIGMILFIALAFIMPLWGMKHLSEIQVILVYSWMCMLVHQFEEYGWPGGFPAFFNIAFWKEHKDYDRYPFNANSCMVNNVFLCYPFYILAIIFPDCIWYGLITVGQGMAQIWNHGYKNNKVLGTWYNPGLAAVLLLHWPLGIYYIHYVSSHGLATTTDYIIGFVGAIASLGFLWAGPVKLQANRNTKYPFDQDRMWGHEDEKLKKLIEK